MNFIDQLVNQGVKKEKAVQTGELTTEQRLQLAQEMIAKRRAFAFELCLTIRRSFFFRGIDRDDVKGSTKNFGPTVLGFPYEITTGFADIRKHTGIRMGYLEKVAIGDDVSLRHMRLLCEHRSHLFWPNGSNPGGGFDEFDTTEVVYQGEVVLFTAQGRWKINGYSNSRYSHRYYDWQKSPDFTFKEGDWQNLLAAAIDPDGVVNEKQSLKERQEAEKRAIRQREAARALSELEAKYGVSVAADGRVIYSKEEIDLERYRADLMDKLERGEGVGS